MLPLDNINVNNCLEMAMLVLVVVVWPIISLYVHVCALYGYTVWKAADLLILFPSVYMCNIVDVVTSVIRRPESGG